MPDAVDTKHPAILSIKEAEKRRISKTKPKPLWSYRLYVIDNFLILDNPWPLVIGSYRPPEMISHGQDLAHLLVRMHKEAQAFGLTLWMYARYYGKINCLLDYQSLIHKLPETRLRLSRLNPDLQVEGSFPTHDAKGKTTKELLIPVYKVNVQPTGNSSLCPHAVRTYKTPKVSE